MNKYNCIIIIGPTASGKTKLSVGLAKKLNTEIINADSTQVYQLLNIGTAKATIQEMEGVTHHLLDIINPDEDFTVSEFRDLSLNIINKLLNENKIPIIVGGTGFYIESLIKNYSYGDSYKSQKVRDEYMNIATSKGNEYLHSLLKKVDPISAEKLHFNDVKRVVRALEIYKLSGKTKSQIEIENTMQNSLHSTTQTLIKPLIIGLNMNRELLYNRINLRTDIMIKSGLIEEVESLIKMGYNTNTKSMQSIGYKELIEYIDGNCSIEDATEKIKQNTRNYAKRQMTWFKRFTNCIWYDISINSNEKIIEDILLKMKKS